MNKSIRLLLGIILGLCIYFLANIAVPSIRFISEFVKAHDWLFRGDITQIVFLIVSLVLMYLFSKRNVATYGIKSVNMSLVVRPVLISIIVSSVFIGIGMVVVMAGGALTERSVDPGMGIGGMLKIILSVWILASISEEVFFRGLLQSFLAPLKDYGFKLLNSHISIPVTISALGFGLAHVVLLNILSTRMAILIIINATILGFIAGYYREKTGSLIPAILVHMTFNVVGNITVVIITKIMLS